MSVLNKTCTVKACSVQYNERNDSYPRPGIVAFKTLDNHSVYSYTGVSICLYFAKMRLYLSLLSFSKGDRTLHF